MSTIIYPKDEAAGMRRALDAARMLAEAGGSAALPFPLDPIVLQRLIRENAAAAQHLVNILTPGAQQASPTLLTPFPRGARRLASLEDQDELPPLVSARR